MPEDSAAIAVRAKSKVEEREPKQDRKKDFWNLVRRERTYSNSPEYTETEFEGQIENNFGLALKRYLVQYFNESWQDGNIDRRDPSERVAKESSFEKERRALANIFFRARIEGYGSLDFSIEIAGFKKLAELFDNNLALFTMFLSAYVPRAFDSSIDGYRASHRLSFEFEIPSDVSKTFSGPDAKDFSGNQPEVTRSIIPDDKYRWVWIIANGSLLVPVLLALILLYVAFRDVSEDRKELSSMQKAIFAQQETQLKLLNEQLLNSRKREEELYKQLLDKLPK